MQSCSKCYIVEAMNLHEYLTSDGALTVAQLKDAIGVGSDAQIRQWQHGYAERKPSEEFCLRIEKATGGAVTVEELRPATTWLRVKDKTWPHPKGRPLVDHGASREVVGAA